jgi:SAM-dependent methyltransferase
MRPVSVEGRATPHMSADEAFEFWQRQAREHRSSHTASWSDRYAIELELDQLVSRVVDGDRVLDVGCANGFSTLRLATSRRVAVRGLDYVPEMIDEARRALAALPAGSAPVVEFEVGDIMDLDEPSDHYDKVVVTRVVINVGDWNRQRRALAEATRVLKPGGILLLSEACLHGWRSLNRLRSEWGLEEIPMPPFNNYLDADRVVEAMAAEARLVARLDFSSSYYVGTRLLKPLLARATGAPINVADPDMDWNRLCSKLPAVGDYGVQVLFVFEKRTG